jgi:SagB-type dehydrogenase family enzyme
LPHSITDRASFGSRLEGTSPRESLSNQAPSSAFDPDAHPSRLTNENAHAWTVDRFSEFLFGLRTELEVERRATFLPLGVPADCLWPASRIFHEHSKLSPAWMPALTVAQIEALTRNLDFKRYPGAPRIALPDVAPLHADLEQVIRARRSRHDFAQRPVALDQVATLLSLSCGVTQDGPIPRRAAPSGGALYPVETYLVAVRVDTVPPGIYHYAALEHVLETVRALDGAESLKPILPSGLFAAAPPLVVTLSLVFERTQLKYVERGYRFALLEAGHIAQNLLLVATALGLNSLCMGGFMDDPFNAVMQFDTGKEAVVYGVLIGYPEG